MLEGPRARASIAWAGLGALVGVGVVVVVSILFFLWAGGITPYDIVTLDQRSRLELEGLSILYMRVVALVVGAPAGCWVMLRTQGMPAAGATGVMTIPWSWLLNAAVLRHIPSGPGDPLILPYASLAMAAATGALARVTTLIVRALSR